MQPEPEGEEIESKKKRKYVLELPEIGQGAFALVYRTREPANPRLAVKRLRATTNKKEDTLRRERHLLRKVRGHANVIRLIDHGDAWIALEYAPATLAAVQIKGTDLSRRGQIKGYFAQLLRGLAYCHAQGVMHRDLKPENVLVDNRCVVKIADFGSAACVGADSLRRRKGADTPYVTLWYRSPELLLCFARYGTIADVWSAGCVLAELLFVGRPLFVAQLDSASSQMDRIWSVRGMPAVGDYEDSEMGRVRAGMSRMRAHVSLDAFRPTMMLAPLCTHQAADLLEFALHPVPSKRLSAEHLLGHSYLTAERPLPFTPAQLCMARFGIVNAK